MEWNPLLVRGSKIFADLRVGKPKRPQSANQWSTRSRLLRGVCCSTAWISSIGTAQSLSSAT